MLTDQRARYDEAAKRYAEQADDRIERKCGPSLSGVALRDCIREEIEASEDNKRAERDLDAQESMARFTQIMGFTALVGLLVGLGSVWLIWATLRETRKMALDTREIGEAQVRAYPYFSIFQISISERKNEDGSNLTATFLGRLKNAGATPAIQINFRFNISEVSPGSIEGIMDDGSTLDKQSAIVGFLSAGVEVQQALTRTFQVDLPSVSSGKNKLRLTYVILYRDIFGNDQQTALESGTVWDVELNGGKSLRWVSDRIHKREGEGEE